MRKKVGRLSAYDINRVYGLGLIAQDGVLCKDRAEFEWRNRRVRRRMAALEAAKVADYYRRMTIAFDTINNGIKDNWPYKRMDLGPASWIEMKWDGIGFEKGDIVKIDADSLNVHGTFKVTGGDSEKGYTLTDFEQHLQKP